MLIALPLELSIVFVCQAEVTSDISRKCLTGMTDCNGRSQLLREDTLHRTGMTATNSM